jgi:hypothetical protein
MKEQRQIQFGMDWKGLHLGTSRAVTNTVVHAETDQSISMLRVVRRWSGNENLC